ncbi:hypothetical protein [Microbispora sp. H11081]|uniref:hypothetical protein n=1 Tax=Microbispora sp. H11081 TaxID=2729107 RepID=UPI001473C004|nr:hypothetical protein [Microbispora sp. H11081]
MADDMTAARNAARALSGRVPGWMVWYGERTGRFWAVPRVSEAIVPRLIEAPSAEDLEKEIRQVEGRPAREQRDEREQAPGVPRPGQPGDTRQETRQDTRQGTAEAGRVPVTR